MTRIAVLLACLALAGAVAAQESQPSSQPSNIRIGGDVQITEAVDGPLHAMGGDVTLDAPVNGKVRIAGGSVKVGPAAAVSDGVSIAGGDVAIEGSIKGKLRVAGGEVRIDGPVAGDASIAAGTLQLGPNARIEGKLKYFGGDLQQDPAAQVKGGIEREQRGSAGMEHMQHTALERFLHGWIWSVGLMVLAALIAAALPGVSDRMARELRERPWVTPLVGLVALTCIPIAAVLVMITVIGIPIGLLALVGYAVLLLLGYVCIAVVAGGMLLDRVKPETAARAAWKAGAATLAMLVLALLVRVPFVGGLFKLSALAIGVGMIVAVVFRHTRKVPASPAAAA
jgi:hypothetical protein